MQAPSGAAASALVAAMLRPSLAPLRVAGGAVGGGVDPWGVFAPPGSEARWAGARAPKHLFPAAFAASRWVSHTPPEPPPDEIARDALGLAALLLSHVAAGAAACALLATAARGGGSCCDGDGHHHHGHSHTTLIMPIVGVVSTCALRAARYGAALGAVAAAHWVRGGARLAAFAPVARPRLYRVKRAVAPACVEGVDGHACRAGAEEAVEAKAAPESELGREPIDGRLHNVAEAIAASGLLLEAGDVLLIEQQGFTVMSVEVDRAWGSVDRRWNVTEADLFAWFARERGYDVFFKVPCNAGPAIGQSAWYFLVANATWFSAEYDAVALATSGDQFAAIRCDGTLANNAPSLLFNVVDDPHERTLLSTKSEYTSTIQDLEFLAMNIYNNQKVDVTYPHGAPQDGIDAVTAFDDNGGYVVPWGCKVQ